MNAPKRLQDVELFAYLGEDEHGSGVVGLKQGVTPAGYIALVATTREKVAAPVRALQMELQARAFGKKIYLCRYVCVEVVEATEAGAAL